VKTQPTEAEQSSAHSSPALVMSLCMGLSITCQYYLVNNFDLKICLNNGRWHECRLDDLLMLEDG